MKNAVDPFVQLRVAKTNGNLYAPLLDRLERYPIPAWPAAPPSAPLAPMLDVGCGWGRWMLSAAAAGYLPVGIDVNIDGLRAALRVLRQHGLDGYVVCADLRSLPFAADTFDKVFSFSVLQHAHRARCVDCLRHLLRILVPGGSCDIQFPIRHGLTNWRHGKDPVLEEDPASWCVRYYSRRELRAAFAIFGNVKIDADCFFGIGVHREDIDLLPWKYKPIVAASEALKTVASFFPPVGQLSDSVFVRARKPGERRPAPATLKSSEPGGNLAILPWLVCPVTQGPLEYDRATHTLVSHAAGLRYPVDDDIPILREEFARKL